MNKFKFTVGSNVLARTFSGSKYVQGVVTEVLVGDIVSRDTVTYEVAYQPYYGGECMVMRVEESNIIPDSAFALALLGD